MSVVIVVKRLPLTLWGTVPVYIPRAPNLAVRVRSDGYEPTPAPDRVFVGRRGRGPRGPR